VQELAPALQSVPDTSWFTIRDAIQRELGFYETLMNQLDRKQAIEHCLKDFSSLPLEQASLHLFDALGYRSEKRLVLRPNNAATFLDTFVHQEPFNKEQALLDDWETVDFLFQLTDTEIQSGSQGSCLYSASVFSSPSILELTTEIIGHLPGNVSANHQEVCHNPLFLV
jgi:hypothetical protein